MALTGFPLTAGYFSKDAIIEAAAVGTNPMASYGFIMTVVAAALTSFYSWRLIFKTFHGEPHDRASLRGGAREPEGDADAARRCSPSARSRPAGRSVPMFKAHGVEGFFRELLKFGRGNTMLENMEQLPLLTSLAPTVMMIGGFLVA